MPQLTRRRDWRLRGTEDATVVANVTLFGSPSFPRPQDHCLDSIVTECTGTPIFSIGDDSAVATYVPSAAHTAMRRRETLVANFPTNSAATSIKVNITVASGTVTVTARGHLTA